MTYPQPLLLDGAEVGLILAARTEESARTRPISINPRVLVEVDDVDNPNHMEDADFRGLTEGMRAHGFGQSVTVYEQDGRWHLIDGVHRKRAAILCGLARIPAIQYTDLRRGEEQVLRVLLNKHRGTLRQDTEQRILSGLLRDGGWTPSELIVTGYSEGELLALSGRDPEPILIPEGTGGSLGPDPDVDEPAAKPKGAAILEVAFESEEDFKEVKRAINRAAKAKGVTKGPRKMEVGLLELIRRAEGEED